MRHRLQMSKKAQTGTQMVLRRQQTRLAVNMLWFSALLSKNSNYLFVPYPPPAQMLLSLSMFRAPSGLCARGAARACAGVRRRAGLLPACCTAGSICLPRMLVCHRPKTMVCWASLPAISPAGGKRCQVQLGEAPGWPCEAVWGWIKAGRSHQLRLKSSPTNLWHRFLCVVFCGGLGVVSSGWCC